MRQWKKQLHPHVFTSVFLTQLSDRVCTLIKQHVKRARFSLLGALYFDKIVRELKTLTSNLSSKPILSGNVLVTSREEIPHRALLEIIEISQVLSCENIDEAESCLADKYHDAVATVEQGG